MSIDVPELGTHAIDAWIAGGIFNIHLSRNIENCGYKESPVYLFYYMQSDNKPITLFHKYNSLNEPSFSFPC